MPNSKPLSKKLSYLSMRILDPQYRPEIIRRARRQVVEGIQSLLGSKNEKLQPCEDWCKQHAIKTDDFFQKHNIENADIEAFEPLRPLIKAGEDRVAAVGYNREIGPANLRLLYVLCRHIGAKDMLETGVAFGWSSLVMLEHRKENGGSGSGSGSGSVVSVDLAPTDATENDFTGIVVPEELQKDWRLMRCADREGLAKLVQEEARFDLAHYDSDKSYEGRIAGYNMMFDMLRPGGVLMSDDVSDNHGFKDFCASKNLEPIVIEDPENQKYEGIVFKPKT